MKQLLTLSLVGISAMLSSCIVPNSPDPVGDSFKRTGDAIGNVVNGAFAKPRPPQTNQQQNYPQPTPYQAPAPRQAPANPNYSLPQ